MFHSPKTIHSTRDGTLKACIDFSGLYDNRILIRNHFKYTIHLLEQVYPCYI